MQVITRDQLTFDWLMNERNHVNNNILIMGNNNKEVSNLIKILQSLNQDIGRVVYDDVAPFNLLEVFYSFDRGFSFKKIVYFGISGEDVDQFLYHVNEQVIKDWLVINLD